ncbi:MAG: hypothetical protein JW834_04005 [Candidatus Diapherotrites archaeon]|nr:hypothetical protein [Candidatus Diapherotrites archaeon]
MSVRSLAALLVIAAALASSVIVEYSEAPAVNESVKYLLSVRDSDTGEAVEDAEVQLFFNEGFVARRKTNVAGLALFSMTALKEGDIKVRVLKEGYTESSYAQRIVRNPGNLQPDESSSPSGFAFLGESTLFSLAVVSAGVIAAAFLLQKNGADVQ